MTPPSPHPGHFFRQQGILLGSCVGLAFIIFLADINIALGVAGGVPYVAVVLLTLWVPSSGSTWLMGILGSVLTLLGFWFSPPGGEWWQVVTNRTLAVLAIWTTALLIVRYKEHLTHLAERDQGFRTMMDLMPHMVFAKNIKGRIIATNQAARDFLGKSDEELRMCGGKYGLYATSHEENLARERDIELIRQSTTIQQAEETYVDGTGNCHVFQASKFPFLWPETGERVLCTVAVDETERKHLEITLSRYAAELEAEVTRRTHRIKELEQRRMQVEKLAALAQVAAGVAHEINNPLASIGQSLVLLRRAISKDHPRYHYLDKMKSAVNRMAHIVQQLYLLYIPDTKGCAEFDVVQTTWDALDIMEKGAKQNGVKLRCRAPHGSLSVRGSQGSLVQVLCNLIQNALDVSKEGQEILVDFDQEKAGSVVISVTDQGSGIPDEVAPYIFDPFFTTKEGEKESRMGLGLAISFRLVESLGGTLDFHTELGKGTAFRVALPTF